MDLFSQIAWHSDRAVLNGWTFRLDYGDISNWNPEEPCFKFLKVKWMIDQYAKLWSLRPDFRPRNIVEIGIYDGGSIAFWNEILKPEKIVGIDLNSQGDSDYFKAYAVANPVVKTHWSTDQANRGRLRELLATEFATTPEFVIDDGSHMYAPTKASFETLFPLLKPGAWYIIEDWGWAYWPELRAPEHPFSKEIPLSKLILELVELCGIKVKLNKFKPVEAPTGLAIYQDTATRPLRTLVSNMIVMSDFVALERGDVPSEELVEFSLDAYLDRPEDIPKPKRSWWSTRFGPSSAPPPR
jgi:hypothetical protein